MLIALTPTGMRPEALKLCREYLSRQNLSTPRLWLVIDDGPQESSITTLKNDWDTVILRPGHVWSASTNTQSRNILAGLDWINAQNIDDVQIAIIEDDDWYGPDWLAFVQAALSEVDLIGEDKARYYNVQYRLYNRLDNIHHASLRASAVTRNGIAALRAACETGLPLIDLEIWKSDISKRLVESTMTVGIKGMPGRPGIAEGHHDNFGKQDLDCSVLMDWIGADAKNYHQYWRQRPMMDNRYRIRMLEARNYGNRALMPGDLLDVSPALKIVWTKRKICEVVGKDEPAPEVRKIAQMDDHGSRLEKSPKKAKDVTAATAPREPTSKPVIEAEKATTQESDTE
jgi:hypothetical protein